MFSVKVSYGSGKSFSIRTPVMADRLPEAERYVTSMLNRVYPDFAIVMVYKGDLEYAVYRIDDPIAIVQITTEDEDV